MKYIGHTPSRHAALDYVAAGGAFPLLDVHNRNLVRTLLAELIRNGAVSGEAVSGSPLSFTPGGLALLHRWVAPTFRNCHCPPLTSRPKPG